MPIPELLATKLHPPPPSRQEIERPHLHKRLNEGLAVNRGLTLVSAPAGFGKSSCVAGWVRTLEGWPVAWLSLDPADDDPRRFLAYLLGALQGVAPGAGRVLADVLQSGELPPVEVISTSLLNDLLAAETGFLLVLDDLHLIQDTVILQVLARLMANLPPQLHLVLITREDPPLPLARLRAGQRLTEVRAQHLRFGAEEAQRFLVEKLALPLSPGDVARLDEKTEGWIVGLQLAALALQGTGAGGELTPADISRFVDSLGGSHRFILDYLTEQVLERQPPEIGHFLLQTAILERLHGDLCNAVTGRTDGHALLRRLFAANLFLVPLDDAGHWYRYHHLFADLLRSRLTYLAAEERAGLHLRASHWYGQAGEAGGAIRHALAAEAYGRVVDLLETHARELIRQGYAKTVDGWLQAVPAGWRRQSTRTALTFAWMHLLRGAYAAAAPYLAQADAALAAQQAEADVALRGEWLAMRSLVLQMEGQTAAAEQLARQALATVPAAAAYARSLASFALAGVLRSAERTAPAVDAYRQSIRAARSADNAVAEMLSTVGLAGMAFEHGRLHLAVEIAAPVVARLEETGPRLPIGGVLYGVLADLYYQWHRPEEAAQYSRRALELSTLGGYKSGRIISRIYLSRLAQLAGDLEAAGRHLRQVEELLSEQVPAYVRQELIAQQVRLYLARNQSDAARLALAGGEPASGAGQFAPVGRPGSAGAAFVDGLPLPMLPAGGRVSHAAGLLYNASLRLLLYEARSAGQGERLAQSVRLADRLLATAGESGYLLVALETRLLRAQMQALRGDAAAAAADYVRALALAEPEQIVGVFVEQGAPVAEALSSLLARQALPGVSPAFVERIVALGGAAVAPTDPAQALVEPLSERELEVLHLIAAGLKYREIADKLFISLNTVRFHVKGIYGKLGVNKRAHAVEQARRLNLL